MPGKTMTNRESPVRAMAGPEHTPPAAAEPEREPTEALPAEKDRTAPESGREKEAVEWAAAHLSEREAVFTRTDLLTAALASYPGAVSVEGAEGSIQALETEGRLHRAPALEGGDGMTTDKALAEESESIALMQGGRSRGKRIMRSWIAQARLHRGPLTDGQKAAVKLILSSKDRVIGVQGYAGTGKTTMLRRARALAQKNGYRLMGLAPSASAVKTLAAEAGIESETLQRFLARNAGVAEGRLTRKGAKALRGAFSKTVLVVDEASLASTVQMRNLLRIAKAIRLPRVVLVGDEKQLDAVDAGKAFAQLQGAGMEDRDDGPDHAPEKPGAQSGRGSEPGRGDQAGVRETRRQRRRSRARQHRGRRGRTVAETVARDARAHRRHGARVMRCGWTSTRTSASGSPARAAIHGRARRGRATRIARLHAGREGDRGQLLGGRRGCVSPPLQAPRRGEGRRAPSGRDRSRKRKGRAAGSGRTSRGVGPRPGGGFKGGSEVYESEAIELRAGDRIRWTRNDPGHGLVNSRTAEVVSVENENCVVPARGRTDAGPERKRCGAAPSGPCLGVHGARVPGANGG